MPFTLSHAAAVLPAVRRDGRGRGPLVTSLLVAGSFAPDIPYYAAGVLPGAMEFGEVTHSLAGAVGVDVLIAGALAAVWLLVREPLVALLPRARQGRPATFVRCGAPRARVRAASVLWWYVSAALGALTHVVWDAFTHPGRWGSLLIPALGRYLAGMPLYTWLQYGSSVLGAVVITVFVVRTVRRVPAGAPVGVPVLSVRDRWSAAAVIGGCAVAGAVQRAVWGHGGATTRLGDLVPTLCFGVGTGLVLGVLLYAAGVRAWRPGPPPGGAGAPGRPESPVRATRPGEAVSAAGRGRPGAR